MYAPVHVYVLAHVCICVFACVCAVLPLLSRSSSPLLKSLVYFHSQWGQIISLGSSQKRKQQGERGLDLEGVTGREGSLENWFLWVAHGRQVSSRSQIFWEVPGNKESGTGCFGHSLELKPAESNEGSLCMLSKTASEGKSVSSLQKIRRQEQRGFFSQPPCCLLDLDFSVWNIYISIVRNGWAVEICLCMGMWFWFPLLSTVLSGYGNGWRLYCYLCVARYVDLLRRDLIKTDI